MGDGDEADLGGDLFEATEHEPSESFVLFDVPEYCFDLPPLPSFLKSLVALKQLFYLLPVADKVGGTLDDAVPFSLVAGPSHRAAFAVFGLVEPVCLDEAVDRLSFFVADVRHRLAHLGSSMCRFPDCKRGGRDLTDCFDISCPFSPSRSSCI